MQKLKQRLEYKHNSIKNYGITLIALAVTIYRINKL